MSVPFLRLLLLSSFCGFSISQTQNTCGFPMYPSSAGDTCTSCLADCNSYSESSYLVNVGSACLNPLNAKRICQSCRECGTTETTIWPCYTGIRSSDSSRCVPSSTFVDIRNTQCSAGSYLDFSPADAKAWKTTDLLAASPSGLYFAVAHPPHFVKIYYSRSLDYPLIPPSTNTNPVLDFYEAQVPLNYAVFKALTWSMEGNILYVLAYDGSIMKMDPSAKTSIRTWALAPNVATTLENPCQHPSSFSSCIALPVIQTQSQQIALICSFDSCTTGNRFSYLVRILNTGENQRLPVDPMLHKAVYPAVNLMYDASWNVAYWTTYSEWPTLDKSSLNSPWATSSTKRKVLRVALSADYNIASITDLLPPSLGPAGISFEAASILPGSSNLLLAFVATSSTSVDLKVFQRGSPLIQVFDPWPEYTYSTSTWHNFPTVDFQLPSRFFITEAGGRVFIQRPQEASIISKYGQCLSCPSGKTTPGTSTGVFKLDECICLNNQWLDQTSPTLECKPLNPCKAGEYVKKFATWYSPYECANCSMCPAGTYRNLQTYCTGKLDFDLDPRNPSHCVPCGTCGAGFFRNLSTCDGTTSMPAGGSFCARCRSCPDMHNIRSDTECTGSGTSDTRQCIYCKDPCGPGADNVYIPSDTTEVGCDGQTLSMQNRTVKPCRPCASSCPEGTIRVSGCNGTTRDPNPVCSTCDRCSYGQYVKETCKGGSSLNVTCAQCTQVCPSGTFFKAGCSGNATLQVCSCFHVVFFCKLHLTCRQSRIWTAHSVQAVPKDSTSTGPAQVEIF